MKEEGLELKLVYMQNAPGLQALIANAVQFSGSGSSALVAISKGNAPLSTSPRVQRSSAAMDRRPAQHQNPARFIRQKGRHHRRGVDRGVHVSQYLYQTQHPQRYRADRSGPRQSAAVALVRRRRRRHRQPGGTLRRAGSRHARSSLYRQGSKKLLGHLRHLREVSSRNNPSSSPALSAPSSKACASRARSAKAPSPQSQNLANSTAPCRRACTTTWSARLRRTATSTNKVKKTTSPSSPKSPT